jgi:hypothetical protein
MKNGLLTTDQTPALTRGVTASDRNALCLLSLLF